jgi:hypothetical protein
LAIHPGSLTNPIQSLRVFMATAQAIDPFVSERYGFGLGDLIEVGLSYCDFRLERLRQSWPTAGLARDQDDPEDETLTERVARIADTPVALRDEEVKASVLCSSEAELWTASCSDSDRAARAWLWATRSADELEVGLSSEPLGAALAVKSKRGILPVPSALVLDALASATGALAEEAAEDPACLKRIQQLTAEVLLRIVQPNRSVDADAGNEGEGAASEESPVGQLLLAFSPARRRVIAVSAVSALDSTGLLEALVVAERELAKIDHEILVEMDAPIDEGASISRLVVYGGPLHVALQGESGIPRIHVDDLLEASLEASESDAGTELGQDYLWQFVEELCSLPGVAELIALDFDDVWRFWLTAGVINPVGYESVPVFASPVPDERRWQRSARWEEIERVLFAAGLPPSWEWISARLDEGTTEATVGLFGEVFLLSSAPPLIVAAPIVPELQRYRLDPAFPVGIADGVRLTAAGNQVVGDALSAIADRPLICRIRVTAERLPGAGDEAAGIGFTGIREPIPIVELLLGIDWLELLAEDPRTAHKLLGHGLAAGLERIGLPIPDAEDFLSAWEAMPPVGLIRTTSDSLVARASGSSYLPRSPATRGRARRSVARCSVRRGLKAGIYTGRAAATLARERVLPLLDDALREAVAGWDASALHSVAEHLNDAHARRAHFGGQLDLALSAPWGDAWRDVALTRPSEAELTRPLELLFEHLLANPPAGGITPDRFDIAEAADVAHEVIRISLAIAGKKRRLHDLVIVVFEGGAIDAVPIDGLSRTPTSNVDRAIDLSAYLLASREHQLQLRPVELPSGEQSVRIHLADASLREDEPFRRLAELDVPERLLKADKLLQERCGTGIDALRAILGTALVWTDEHDHVLSVSRGELIAAAANWSSLPRAQLVAALDHLTLDPAEVRIEGIAHAEQERRRHRLATRPLALLPDDALLVMPWRVRATQQVYLNYLLDGRLPWHSSELPEDVRNAFNNFRTYLNESLEREASQAAQECKLPWRPNLKEHEAAVVGLEIPGEIDLLVADPERRLLWVCEAKDLSQAVSPTTMASRVDLFLDEKDGYVRRLLARHAAVAAAVSAALRLLEIESSGEGWQVLPLMVTRRVEPAAFASDVAVPFTPVSGLAAILRDGGVPSADTG